MLRKLLVNFSLFLISLALVVFLSPCKFSGFGWLGDDTALNRSLWKLCGRDIFAIFNPNARIFDSEVELWGIFRVGTGLPAIFATLAVTGVVFVILVGLVRVAKLILTQRGKVNTPGS